MMSILTSACLLSTLSIHIFLTFHLHLLPSLFPYCHLSLYPTPVSSTWKCAYVFPLCHPDEMEPGLAGEVIPTLQLSANATASDVYSLASGATAGRTSDGGTEGSFGFITASINKAKKDASVKQGRDDSSNYVQQRVRKLPTKSKDDADIKVKNKHYHHAQHSQEEKRSTTNAIIDYNNTAKRRVETPSSDSGVTWIGWSHDGRYLAATEYMHPQCLWIFDVLESKLVDVIVQLDSIHVSTVGMMISPRMMLMLMIIIIIISILTRPLSLPLPIHILLLSSLDSLFFCIVCTLVS
jgi:hypothetical protein